MTVDNLLPTPWPEEAIAALDSWRQGHLIQGKAGVWLAAAGSVDLVTGVDLSGYDGGLVPALADISDTDYLAVVSQTCDIVAAGPGLRHPFVQVCPVRDIGAAFSSEKVKQIRGGEIVEYVYLTNPPEPQKEWAIDLRVSTPLSKGALVVNRPIEGFLCEDDELELGARIAAKYERPALHDYLSKSLIDSLKVFITRAKKSQDWCDDVEQLRLVVEGPRLTPKRVRLLVVTDVNFHSLFPSKTKPLREHWKTHKNALKTAGIDQAPIAFRHIEKMAVKDYRGSIPLYIPGLGRGRFD